MRQALAILGATLATLFLGALSIAWGKVVGIEASRFLEGVIYIVAILGVGVAWIVVFRWLGGDE